MGSLSDGAPRWGRVSQPGHLHVAEVGDAHGGQAAAGHQDEAAAADTVGSEALLRGSGAGSGSAAGSPPPPPHPSPRAGHLVLGEAEARHPLGHLRAAPAQGGRGRGLHGGRRVPPGPVPPATGASCGRPAPSRPRLRSAVSGGALRLRSAVPMAAAPPAAPQGPRFEPPGGLSGASGTGRGRRAGAEGGAGAFPLVSERPEALRGCSISPCVLSAVRKRGCSPTDGA